LEERFPLGSVRFVVLTERGAEPARVRSRYPALDILRGLALVSMASSHVARYREDTVIGKVLHSGQWIDGAFLFVALSGVVVGLVHRRIIERRGLRPSIHKLLRRAGFLYLVHVSLTFLAVVAGWAVGDDRVDGVPHWAGTGGLPRAIGRVLFLRLEPADNGVLPLYVVFMLMAVPAVVLLRRGRWRTVVVGSLAIYAAGWAIGGLSFVPDEFQPTGWQVLFMGGLLVGWAWEHERLALPEDLRRRIVALASVAAAGFLGLALVAPGHGERLFGRLVDKMAGGPVAFVYAAAVMVAAYVVLERALRYRAATTLLAPLRILGSKGLPGYAALQVAIVVLDLVPALPRNDGMVVLVVTICGFTEYGAVALQQQRRGRTGLLAGGPADVAGPEPVVVAVEAGPEPHAGVVRPRRDADADADAEAGPLEPVLDLRSRPQVEVQPPNAPATATSAKRSWS
jgi:hypothetical protein